MNKSLMIVIVFIVLGVGGYMLVSKSMSGVTVQPSQTIQTDTAGIPTETPGITETSELTVQGATITVEGGMYWFKPDEIRVKAGETVTVTLTNKEGLHDFVIDELNVRTKMIKAGETDTVTFVATAGVYEYYCSVGDHRVKGMVGKLIVE